MCAQNTEFPVMDISSLPPRGGQPKYTKEQLIQALADNENVLTLQMEEVRDAWQKKRLGIHVRRQISDDLRGLGVGHFPPELPEYQNQLVRLYRHGTPVARIIEAVLNPSSEHDQHLRAVTADDARTILEAIRELVCE